MPPFRSKEFWQKFDRNILMLDLLKRKLQNDATIIEVAQPFSRKMRDGELLAIEFISHLAGFCQAFNGLAQSELPKDDDNGTPAETRPLLSPPIKPESEPETEHTTILIEQN
ncbi:hypothetical protein PGT21_000183 [Puccinia graminis f. sp. tritici]|uniref:Uncharacterized protein n=1 Tax=Puccinia graminis f. sp. tritici TaxID=56615 RepID=A0A5B0QDC3_PUCGR|nr:hypothetical protein PGTUg99_003100 [Puccinia graminis f. sp. tritici]KAA1095975.1 hypothetical protein PGT21_000183 [Puccinia graminis f. sp. tritici]KAA1111217.1 hypothetical protein PGTUg99_002242 [Puccinia graminis f. sp. tritici]